MRYENFRKDFNKTAIFSAQTYGTKTTVELDHSDLDLDEVMDVFQTLIVGMGYDIDSQIVWFTGLSSLRGWGYAYDISVYENNIAAITASFKGVPPVLYPLM